jgi:hypothetical protein
LFGLLACALAATLSAQPSGSQFRRIATFPVVLNTCAGQPDTCWDTQTVSEIITASPDGETLIYTDAATGYIGFVDISDASDPRPAGFIETDGDPTSVSVAQGYALAAVNTSDDFVNTSGQLLVIDIDSHAVVRTIELGGQPDSVAVSPNQRYAVVIIENERNEAACVGGTANGQEVDEDDCEDGGGKLGVPGQSPGGFLTIVDMTGRSPASWSTRRVSLNGIANLYPNDPEPEFADINYAHVAAITMQENNHIVLVHVPTGQILDDFSARTADLNQIDTEEEDVITLDSSLSKVLREPDAVVWISNLEFATADEGDLDGGSRGFTIFNANGGIRYTSGNLMDHIAARIGHYPESRSENKGTEPEGVEFGLYGSRRLLFVGSERASFVAVFEVPPLGEPRYIQALSGGTGPEGLLAIPSRNLFVTASEEDAREDLLRSAITIYRLGGTADYPTIVSANRPDRTPIPWGALSGLTSDPSQPGIAYAVSDSIYSQSRIYKLDVSQTPAVITEDIVVRDRAGRALSLDLEGIAMRRDGGFWLASEGAGNCTAEDCGGVGSTNLLYRVDAFGVVRETVALPESVDAIQRSNGYEGVAVTGSGSSEVVYVAFQREWNLADPGGWVRIGRYTVETGEWAFYYYPLDSVASPNGGWIGLSEITSLGGGRFAVIERDNQGNIDAAVKKLYTFSVNRVTPLAAEALTTDPTDPDFPALTKTLARDILPDLQATNGLVIEKVEGLTVLPGGDAIIVTDNDGVDGSSGETQLIHLGPIF